MAKEKDLKGIIKPVSVYPHTDYRRSEIYPHTEYHRQEPFWVYREVGLLKQWLMSLTKLYNKLAMMETDDVTELTQEIKDLIDKLQSLLNGIEAEIIKLADVEEKYKTDVYTMLSYINALATDVNTIITNFTPLFNELFNCIENRLIIHDNYIEDFSGDFSNIENRITNIEQDIKNIYEALENEFTDTSITLNYLSDYTIEFVNGYQFYNEDQTPNMTYRKESILSNEYHILHFTFSSPDNGHAITNSFVWNKDTINNEEAPLFRHSLAWDYCWQSWVCIFKFINDYSFLQNLSSAGYEENSISIWNLTPTSARACWGVNFACGMVNNVSTDGHYDLGRGLNLNVINISDGYNNQYSTYINMGVEELTYSNLNVDMQMTLK